MTQAAASTVIVNANLTVGTITQEFSATVASGSVISQSPTAGLSVTPGTAVNLVVSKGAATPGDEETVMLPGKVPLVMVWIQGGTFTMGSPSGMFASERPEHVVTVGNCWMGKYELTKRQWQSMMGTSPWTGHSTVLDDLDSPAVYVSWNESLEFIAALNTYTGKRFRLPSEAEWEHACRAGTSTDYYWNTIGGNISDNAWYDGNTWPSESYAHVVGLKLPNTFGLYDMSGNVWEYCQDWYHDDYNGAPTDGGAWETPVGYLRVNKGGSFSSYSDICRSATRGYCNPTDGADYWGVRPAR